VKRLKYLLLFILLLPLPVLANENNTTTITEEFDENGWTSIISYDSGGAENSVTNLYAGTYLCDGYCLEYNRNSQTGFTLRLWWDRTDIHTFAVDLSGLNNDWDIKYIYTDETDSGWVVNTFTPNQPEQNPSWEDNEFSYTETSGKYIKEVNLNFYADYMGLDNIAITYNNPPTTTTTTTTTTSTTTTTTVPPTTTTTTTTTVPPTTTTTTTVPPTTTTTSTTTTTTTTTTIPLSADEIEIQNNYAETGLYETNDERAEREYQEWLDRQPPEPEPEPEPEPIIVIIDGVEEEYTEEQIEQGDAQRDKERSANEDAYGCYMTNAQIERGDCAIPEEEKILEEEVIIEDYDTETESNTEGELLENDDVVLEMESEDEVADIKDFDIQEDLQDKDIKVIFEDEERIDSRDKEPIVLDDAEIFEEDVLEDDTEFIVIEVEEEIEDEIFEEDLESDKSGDMVLPEEKVLEENDEGLVELTEEEIEEELEELSEVIEEIVELPIEVTEEVTEEELEEIVEEYVEQLSDEEVVEVLEEVNDIGVQNLEAAPQEVQEIVQAVVVEAIESVEELTEEQVEVVAEVLQVESTEDVEVYAEAAESEKSVEVAIEEYVERSVANADVENYNIADVVSEVNVELFLENPIGAIIDVDLSGIELTNIGADMPDTQREKAQEVFAPVVLTQIVAITRRRII
jgi:hypothetical protein